MTVRDRATAAAEEPQAMLGGDRASGPGATVSTCSAGRYLREPDGAGSPGLEGPHRIVIVGAGGFGREVLQYAHDAMRLQPGYTVKGFLDDDPSDLAALGLDLPVLGGTHHYDFEPSDRALIAVGEPSLRLAMAARLEDSGARFVTLVHPLAYVSEAATLGAGCIVAPFASVGAHAQLGDHSVLTFYASVGHDARIGRGCGFSPHAVANGGAVLGDGVFLGAYAVVNPTRTVGSGSKVAAGAVVYHPVPSDVLAVGNPARPRPLWKR